MTTWTPEELASVDITDEVQVASLRADGTRRPFVTIWAVRLGDDVFVRSARQENPWFRYAVTSGGGTLRVAGVERHVSFERSTTRAEDVDAVYRTKYQHYSSGIVGSVVGMLAHDRTLRLTPVD